ncbi:MAG: hypothetical protein VKJ44_08785 [Synechococcus sp.]|nr:hypothetical protein [Synechococcus sp.]
MTARVLASVLALAIAAIPSHSLAKDQQQVDSSSSTTSQSAPSSPSSGQNRN